MYKQTLYNINTDHINTKEVKKNNKYKKYNYGYNKDLDCVVISKDGTIGEIYEIQGLKIALPLAPEKIDGQDLKKENQVFRKRQKPGSLNKIKSIHEFKSFPDDIKEEYYDYIEIEFNRRNDGYWFMCNGEPCYLTGSHYMYLNWTKIDVGAPEFRQSNKLFYYFWEACKADERCYGMCYLKNRRSGFSFMASSETVNVATISRDSRFGILSKSGSDAKKMFTDKVVPISSNYPFFFKPIQDGMDKPKTELSYRLPASKLTRNSFKVKTEQSEEGLDTTIDWKNTGDNSYDGEKLKLLVHDESGKWDKPDNILNNWRVTKTCLRLGARVVGKCMMGSTSNALDKGGENFKKLYDDSDLTKTKRNRNGQTPSGLYALFIPMEWNYEGFINKYGFPVFDTPEEPVEGIDGGNVYTGVVEHWENEADGLKNNSDALNEFYRQFPRTEQHAFRDETKDSIFNLAKIYEQIDYNEEMVLSGYVTTGSFQWANGVKDTKVEWHPNKNGRFKLSWIPSLQMQNAFETKNGIKYPGNKEFGAFGCDSYDISGTVDGGGSNGALHGLTAFSMHPDVPSSQFFLEYVARPQTAEIFFEDVLMAIVFYGMPILAENNKPRLLYYLKRRGYRGYSMNRPDKLLNKLSVTEKELGGIPNSSEDIRQAHASAIESYIQNHVGMHENGDYGNMYFQRTLQDWAKFNVNNRTKYDASISSGLAIMACQRHLYSPRSIREKKKVDFGFSKYNNSGLKSKIIQ
jgi:hypothetical protein